MVTQREGRYCVASIADDVETHKNEMQLLHAKDFDVRIGGVTLMWSLASF